MAKKATTTTAADELLKNKTVTLSGDSRASVYEQGEALVTQLPDDVTWSRSIVMHADGTFAQVYYIVS